MDNLNQWMIHVKNMLVKYIAWVLEHPGNSALAGGWADVVVVEAAQRPAKRLKWRSNAWLSQAPSQKLLLPDHVWLCAWSFLGGGALLEAARLHTAIASVSRRFRALPLPQVLGAIDADFLACRRSRRCRRCCGWARTGCSSGNCACSTSVPT